MTQTDTTAPTCMQWRKSSYSTGGNQCVEVARVDKAVAVRDSKNPDAGHVSFGVASWKAFLGSAKHGSYDV